MNHPIFQNIYIELVALSDASFLPPIWCLHMPGGPLRRVRRIKSSIITRHIVPWWAINGNAPIYLRDFKMQAQALLALCMLLLKALLVGRVPYQNSMGLDAIWWHGIESWNSFREIERCNCKAKYCTKGGNQTMRQVIIITILYTE